MRAILTLLWTSFRSRATEWIYPSRPPSNHRLPLPDLWTLWPSHTKSLLGTWTEVRLVTQRALRWSVHRTWSVYSGHLGMVNFC
ncbi:uncharacterized protein DEA37_0014356 [Paragonimus westermani]|uniref:Secreted protein n=1 Tax=Paragonimus westermani TaxID=34504 RepID=A0A5J4NAB7_9TREM|nr:uncharacterized protein DEA37_0014356 [Paragonimus westermani]